MLFVNHKISCSDRGSKKRKGDDYGDNVDDSDDDDDDDDDDKYRNKRECASKTINAG